MAGRMSGKRVVVTQANKFMGNDLVTLFESEGAEVISDITDLKVPGAAEEVIERAGSVDVLIANLAAEQPRVGVLDIDHDTFATMFTSMVYPLHRLVQATLPQMMKRRKGKIVVMGSAAALKGISNYAAYSSARGAQLAYVQAVGTEVAQNNVQINAIAQSFVENPTYFSPSYTETPEFKERLKGVPTGRLALGWESAALALFLAGDESDFLVGQSIPFSGGWVT